MKILVTNDDGYKSTGIRAALAAVKPFASEIYLFAPYEQQSGVGGKVTFSEEIKFTEYELDGIKGYAVHGTPADVIRMALIVKGLKPDLIVSGINFGEQIGSVAVHMSGTMAALVYGAAFGIPGIGLSMVPQDEAHKFHNHNESELHSMEDYPGKIATKIVGYAIKNGLSGAEFWNVNFPKEPSEEVIVVPMERSWHWQNEEITLKEDSFIEWGKMLPPKEPKGNDLEHICDKITITPCKADFTDFEAIKRLKEGIKRI